MSNATKPNWIFLVGAASCFVAGGANLLVHQLLLAGGFLFIGAYQLLAATGALEAKGTGKYRLASVFAVIGCVLSFAGLFQYLLARSP
jgi:hypothetical protein